MRSDSEAVVLPSVDAEPQAVAGRQQGQEQVEGSSDAGDVRGTLRRGRGLGGTPVGTASGTPVRSGIGSEAEPGPGADRGSDGEGVVLAADEGLEVVVGDALPEGAKVTEGASLEQECVLSEPAGEASDGGLGARPGAGDLAVGGAGLEGGGDFFGEVAPLEVIGEGEGLP
jgi:hypothetical protein